MATTTPNLKKRKPDQESDLLGSSVKPPQPISYIPKHDAGDSDDSDAGSPGEDSVTKLLEPLTKEQLIALLHTAAVAHPPTLAEVRRTADLDPSHRKIFVHGLDWTTNSESLRLAFSPFGPIDDVRVVTDKSTGKSKGYGFILFANRKSTKKALKQPQKLIDGRMTFCQLASVGPPSAIAASGPNFASNPSHNPSSNHQGDNLPRKIFVGNVHPDVDVMRLKAFFAQFGEIEEGPLGLDRTTGKPKGFALFVYKTIEGAKKALAEPSKFFEGHMLICQRASDNSNKGARGPMGAPNPSHNPNPNPNTNSNPNPNFAQNAVAVPGSVEPGYPGPAVVPGMVPDMAALVAQELTQQSNALLAIFGAASQNQGAFGMNPALLASLNPAAIAAAFGIATPNVPPAPGVQPAVTVANQGGGGMGSVGYQQNVGGFQGPPGFQGLPGFQSAPQVGAYQGEVSGAGGSYQGGAMGQAPPVPRSLVGQMGGYGQH